MLWTKVWTDGHTDRRRPLPFPPLPLAGDNKSSISLRQKAPCDIWWKLVKPFQGCLKIIGFVHARDKGRYHAALHRGQKFDCNWSFTTLIIHYQFQPLVFNTMLIKWFFIFPIQMIKEQNLTLFKKIKCQSRIIIWTNLVDLEFPMLCTKIQPQSALGSEEEYFWSGFMPYWYGGHLNGLWPFLQIFNSPSTEGSTWSLKIFDPGVSEEVVQRCERTDKWS